MRETNREGAKESGGSECTLTLLALNDVDSVEVVRKGDDSPKPSANELPNHISRYLSPGHGIGPEDSHTQSYLHGMIVFQGMKEMVQEGWLTTGFTWPPETLLAIHAPRETPVSMFSIRRTIEDKS